MTRTEREYLKHNRGPREKAYRAVITLHFLGDPDMDLEAIKDRLFLLLRTDLLGVTMPTKRLPTHMDISEVDL